MVASQIPEFELHGVTAKLAMIYERTLECSELCLSAECDQLCAINPQNQKTIAR